MAYNRTTIHRFFLPVAPIIIKSYIIIPFPFDYSAVFSYFCPIVYKMAHNALW